jgi:hypothetical protein
MGREGAMEKYLPDLDKKYPEKLWKLKQEN